MNDADLEREISKAERNAWNALSRYKFQMFGYWAAIWVHLNRLRKEPQGNPFGALVKEARLTMGRAQEE